MSRKIKFSTRKETKLPNARTLGFNVWKAKAGDLITYVEQPTGHSRIARVIGEITWCDGDGPDCRGHLAVLALSDDGTFGYERWVDPKDVIECKRPGRALEFLRWFVDATPDDLVAYGREDEATRKAAHPGTGSLR